MKVQTKEEVQAARLKMAYSILNKVVATMKKGGINLSEPFVEEIDGEYLLSLECAEPKSAASELEYEVARHDSAQAQDKAYWSEGTYFWKEDKYIRPSAGIRIKF